MKLFLSILAAAIVSPAFLPQDDAFAQSKARGKALYEELCITCHLAEGTGTEGIFPPLAKSDYLMTKPEAAIRAVKYGQEGEITVNGVTYNNIMPAPGVSGQEVADLMNYIRNSWGNKGDFVSAGDVEKVEK